MFRLCLGYSLLLLLTLKISYAQEPVSMNHPEEFSGAIEDNSFFIEEAYNQEAGVVQHITTGMYSSTPQHDVALSFTQEWPVGSQAHQLSYTIPYALLNSNTVSGFGDILLNYRYQVSTGEDWAAFAPRVSAILPTGSSNKGTGSGVVGIQFNLPVSKRLTEHLVAHLNCGATVMPSVKGTIATGAELRRTLVHTNAGGSIIVLASSQLNMMLEALINSTGEIGSSGDVERTTETTISPGFRYAIDVDQLQIVPGVAVPFVLSGAGNRSGMFLYVSFEHPF